ncbi:MAG: amidohydrolase family protein [Bacteroidota bacterium]|nr:amidohydrolase family protein [Bacteroidota bacterium]
MRKYLSLSAALVILFNCFLFIDKINAQSTFPVNGIANPTEDAYAFINATIVKDASNKISNATLLIRNKKIITVGNDISIPKDAVVIDCKGKYIYPSFIDLYSDYGITSSPKNITRSNRSSTYQFTSNTKGAVGWNQAIKSEVNAFKLFDTDEKNAKSLRDAGFGVVLTHQKDGIARGTGTLVTLANKADNLVMLRERASAQYSFSKGTSTQSYPSSLMGVIALLRQTYLNASWYKNNPADEGKNISLAAWNNSQNLPQIFEANDKWNCLRANRIANEFGVKYILKAGGNEYQRIKEMAATKATFILPLNFPQPMDVEDPNDARFVSLADMENWELAPTNPVAFEKANIPFCLTADGLKDAKSFFSNLRKSIDAGLSEKTALEALTKNPAIVLNVFDEVGSLEPGKLANFIITNGPVFEEKTAILQNWVQGEKYGVKEDAWKNVAATYNLVITSSDGSISNYILDVKSAGAASVIGKDTLNTKFSFDGKLVKAIFSLTIPKKKIEKKPDTLIIRDTVASKINPPQNQNDSIAKAQRPPDDKLPENQRQKGISHVTGGRPLPGGDIGPAIRLSGVSNGNIWQGNGVDTSGNMLYWTATLIKENLPKPDTLKKKTPSPLGKITYPFGAYGWETMPTQKDILIKNATVWTSEKEGVLQNTDVLVKDGKIAAIGKNISSSAAIIIDGTGKHLAPGIIDEHSHIATVSINEGGQSVTSEVRIGDNLNPEDINIYRQLSGGVTTSHILHGSANTIGGQTQLIKLRWGVNDTALKFAGADPFIKFALGENVKNTRSINNNRFPDTRMGVEEVLNDAFTRARDYEKAMKLYENRPKNSKLIPVRRDLELDALVEILNKKRFITCHSYVQSEIISAMRIAEKFGFRFNTFTHILEGYKVADKMKLHGANASTFSDWWNYKMEVVDAIPQNASIMHKMGLNVAINSDDAEMARRLNQEAAKSIKYGMSEEEALKMVTINPAIMLHIQDKTGSIKVGKDADLVLWTNDPLSIYAIASKTIVDGIIYFDRDRDIMLRKQIAQERNRLVQKLSAEKKSGTPMIAAQASEQVVLHCEEDGGNNETSTSNQ